MKKNAMERLNDVVYKKGPLLAGLDPDISKISSLLQISEEDERDYGDLTYEFCKKYLDALKNEVGAVKINSAFFEAIGAEDCYWNVARYAKRLGYFVIGDVKRADIGNTSAQYAEAYLSVMSPFDCITINPYFGTDGIKPFLDLAKENRKGVFVLVKTSNPSSSEIQDLIVEDGRPVYMHVADLVKKWGEYTDPKGEHEYNLVGAVVGATHPLQASVLREAMPNTFFLVPGYGAQGATAQDITVNFDNHGCGAIVNSSRGIMMACKNDRWKNKYSVKQWAEASLAEVKRAKDELEFAVMYALETRP